MSELSLSLQARTVLEQLLATLVGSAVFLAALHWLAPAALPQLASAAGGAVLLAAVSGAAVLLLTALLLGARRTAALRRAARAVRSAGAGYYGERVRREEVRAIDDAALLSAALNELGALLAAAEQRRVELLGDVAHELRTPVAILLGYLEGLLDGYVKPEQQTWAMLHDEASRLHRLVDELQDLSHLQARQMPAEWGLVDPEQVARRALERLQLYFAEKGLTVVSEIAPNLPPVRANPDYLAQVLNNLLTNSLRYTPAPGEVTLLLQPEQHGAAVLFAVRDSGAGIAPEHIPHLFERFFRVDRSRNRAGGGSGIGLPLAKALVEAMGGRIWAESAGLGSGSTFSFTVPVVATTPTGPHHAPRGLLHRSGAS